MSTTRKAEAILDLPESRAGRRRSARGWYSAAVGVVGMVLLGAGQPPASAPPASAPSAPRPMDQTAAPAAATPAAPAASPMAEPVRLIREAQQAYKNVRDYTCLLIKSESVNGKLPPESVMEMKVRVQPFSVYLRWLKPSSDAGQEVCYVAGRNDGKIRVHPSGVLGAVGFISLDPSDPRLRKASRRSIQEAGIGNTIERFARSWENEENWKRIAGVRVAEYTYNKRRCLRVETVHPANDGHFLYYRDVVYFDKETHLPIRLEFFDWPRRQGDPGQLVEVYNFLNMRLNVGLTDDTFNR